MTAALKPERPVRPSSAGRLGPFGRASLSDEEAEDRWSRSIRVSLIRAIVLGGWSDEMGAGEREGADGDAERDGRLKSAKNVVSVAQTNAAVPSHALGIAIRN